MNYIIYSENNVTAKKQKLSNFVYKALLTLVKLRNSKRQLIKKIPELLLTVNRKVSTDVSVDE